MKRNYLELHIDRINSFVAQLDENTLSALNGISKTKTFKKGDFLLRQDDVCRTSYWIKKGIVRKYYLNDGKDITTELLFEDDIAVSFDSYVSQSRSKEFIQALTNSTVISTDYNEFQGAKTNFPKLVELDLLITEFYAIWLENKLFDLYTLNATQRYLKLVEEHPYIVKNIALTYIASYLGISLETLSRIRAKI
jgi:CRP-like cAMP-binding protein